MYQGNPNLNYLANVNAPAARPQRMLLPLIDRSPSPLAKNSMALEVVNLLLDGLVSFVDGASFVFFKGAAAALLLFLSVLKLPGCVLCCLLCHVRRGTEELLQFATNSLADAAASLANSGGRAAAGGLDSARHILKDAAAYLGESINSAIGIVPGLICGVAAAAATAAAKMVASVATNFLEAAKD